MVVSIMIDLNQQKKVRKKVRKVRADRVHGVHADDRERGDTSFVKRSQKCAGLFFLLTNT